jgi:flagellar motor switch protein FliG
MNNLKTKKNALTGLEKTAILMNVLGKEKTFDLMKEMKDADLRRLLKLMGNMKKAPIQIINTVLREFLFRLSEKEEIIFDENLTQPDVVTEG